MNTYPGDFIVVSEDEVKLVVTSHSENLRAFRWNKISVYTMMYIEVINMIITKQKSITDLRNSLFETFEQVVAGESQIITHKNGKKIAMVPADTINELTEQVELHKNLAIGYAQALRGEGIASSELKNKLKEKEMALKAKYG